MFTMMNKARLSVGVQGLAIAERAYQQAVALCARATPGPGRGPPTDGAASPIIEHPDVRRMLLTIEVLDRGAARRSCTSSPSRSTSPSTTLTPTVRAERRALVELLTPVAKAWGTDLGVELTVARPPGPRRHGLRRGDRRGAALPRRTHRPDLRGDQRHPGDRPRDPQAADGRRPRRVRLPRPSRRHRRRAGRRPARSSPRSARTSSPRSGSLRTATDAGARRTHRRPGRRARRRHAVPADLRHRHRRLAHGPPGRSPPTADSPRATTDADFLQAKVVTARFYCEQLLPQAAGLLPAVTTPPDAWLALDPDLL